ncbi:MAG: 3-oxoacyl-ACP synthase [Deltaproteobacteria bacterium]|nr:3-oxoacyl-ACP synthase [Deltaproteobacteria bacterium]
MGHRFLDVTLRLLGTGHCLPGPPLATAEGLARLRDNLGLDLVRKGARVAGLLGIEARHTCRELRASLEAPRPGQANHQLAAQALGEALTQAGLPAAGLGFLLGHTATPSTQLPPNIAWVADELGFDGPYAELRQACTGFAAALLQAAGLLALPGAAPVGVVGSETGSLYCRLDSAFLDREQLVNLLQMGDGAGAAVVGPEDREPGPRLSHLYYGRLDGKRQPGIWLAGGRPGQELRYRHNWRGIKQHGLALFRAGLAAVAQGGLDPLSLDWFLPHQASGRLAREMALGLGLSPERVVVHADRLGNLGSAAIWVSLDRLRRSGRLQPGERVLVLGAEASKYLYGGFVYHHEVP